MLSPLHILNLRYSKLKLWLPPGDYFKTTAIYVIFINGLPNCLSNCESRMFADNTHLPYADNSVDYIATNIQVAFVAVAPMDLGKQGQHW